MATEERPGEVVLGWYSFPFGKKLQKIWRRRDTDKASTWLAEIAARHGVDVYAGSGQPVLAVARVEDPDAPAVPKDHVSGVDYGRTWWIEVWQME